MTQVGKEFKKTYAVLFECVKYSFNIIYLDDFHTRLFKHLFLFLSQ